MKIALCGAVLVAALAARARAADYVLSFEQRDRFEGLARSSPGRKFDILEVWADDQKVHEIDLFHTGPLWHERVRFAATDPNNLRLAFRLTHCGSADPQVEIGNVRVRDARGAEVALVGRWAPRRTSPSFLLHRWSFRPLPAYRDGFTLRHAYGTPVKRGDYAEWRFEGKLAPVANLQLRRLFEYPGCYARLNFYDDWKRLSFHPRHHQPGEKVTITAAVFNSGSLAVQGAGVALLVDGRLLGKRSVDVDACSQGRVSFQWRATPGFHCFVVRADPENRIRETREDDNWLLRTLVVGEPRKAHPYLLFRAKDIPKLKARLRNPPPWYARYYEHTKRMAGLVQPEDGGRYEETSAIVAAHNALLALLEPGLRPLDPRKRPVEASTRERAIEFLKTMWQFHRGWFGDAPCAIANYAQAYDWVAPFLSPEDDRQIRSRLAAAVEERVRELRAGTDPRVRKGPAPAREDSFYPARRRSYSQGTYIEACGIVVGALALAGWQGADEWLHFGLNAIDEEILREMTTPSGYYREGHGYMQMAESRTGATCWLALAHAGASPFELWPQVARMHDLFIRDRMPNGWCPPINDNRATCALPQCLYASLYADPATRRAARWDWKNQTHTRRGYLPDAHFGALFLLFDTPEADARPAAPPPWLPTQFLGDYLVFRSDWSAEAAYLCLNTKHFPTTSASHDQNDKNSFLLYAKKAFLAIDPGYGNTAGPLARQVVGWCRGRSNIFNHNMIAVDGQLPTAIHRSPYAYPNSPFPRNTFTTDFLDFGEAHLAEWDFRDRRRGNLPCLINHRRSVIFPHLSASPTHHYFILVDALESISDNTHTCEFVLNGNCRRPYLDAERPGDFLYNPRRPQDVPAADNLSVQKHNGGLEARWVIRNADGKDVAFRAFIARPAPSQLEASTGNGWLGYVRPVARNKYLVAKVVGRRNLSFTTILYPDLLSDPRDDVRIESRGGEATLTFPDGTTHTVATRESGGEDADAPDIAFFVENAAGKLQACFLARASGFERGGVALRASARLRLLALDFRKPHEVRGYLSAPTVADLQLRLDRACRSATFNGKQVALAREGATTTLRELSGEGELRILLER